MSSKDEREYADVASVAGQITRELAAVLPAATVTELPGAGHEALDTAPDLLVTEILRFAGDETLPG
jgi:hypothetical protein